MTAQENKPNWLEATVGKGTTETIIGMGGRVAAPVSPVAIAGEYKPVADIPNLVYSQASDSAEKAVREALKRFQNSHKFAQSDIEALENRILARHKEVAHYEKEIAKLESVLKAFQYDADRS